MYMYNVLYGSYSSTQSNSDLVNSTNKVIFYNKSSSYPDFWSNINFESMNFLLLINSEVDSKQNASITPVVLIRAPHMYIEFSPFHFSGIRGRPLEGVSAKFHRFRVNAFLARGHQ